jgi:hypothetical protein
MVFEGRLMGLRVIRGVENIKERDPIVKTGGNIEKGAGVECSCSRCSIKVHWRY